MDKFFDSMARILLTVVTFSTLTLLRADTFFFYFVGMLLGGFMMWQVTRTTDARKGGK